MMVLGQKNSESGLFVKTQFQEIFWVVLTLTQMCFNTNKFLDWVMVFQVEGKNHQI